MPSVRDLKFAVITPTGTGDQTVVAANPLGRFVVVSYALVASAATVVTFKAASTAISGPMSLAANGGVAAGGSLDLPLFQTGANEALVINQSVDGVDGHLTYFLVRT